MPLDVFDKDGNHLGFIRRNHGEHEKIYTVVITDLKAEDIGIYIDDIKNYLAKVFRCKSLLGKIDEDLFKQLSLQAFREAYKDVTMPINNDDLLKFLILKYIGNKDISEFMATNINLNDIKGYIYIDIDEIDIVDGKITLREDLGYISDIRVDDIPPVFGRIADYPLREILNYDILGRNHTHLTTLKVKSGNIIEEVEIPSIIDCSLDMDIQLYMEVGKVVKVFCNNVVYKI